MRLKKEGSCINIENEVDAWSRKTGAHASLFRKRPAVSPSDPKGVVSRDEGIRVRGFSCTKSAPGAGCPLPAAEKKSAFFNF